MAEKQNGQTSAPKSHGWLANLLPERIQTRVMTGLASLAILPVIGWFAKIRPFINEVALEMKKVSWPSRSEVVNTTIITIVVVIFFALFLWAADIGLSYLIHGIEWVVRKVFG